MLLDPELMPILKAMAAAAGTAAAVLLLCGWFQQLARPTSISVGSVLGAAAGFFVGCWLLGVKPHWPPREDQDRLLLVLFPALIAVELTAALPGRISRVAWPLRFGVAAVAARILLHNTIYLADLGFPGTPQWSPAQSLADPGGIGHGAGGRLGGAGNAGAAESGPCGAVGGVSRLCWGRADRHALRLLQRRSTGIGPRGRPGRGNARFTAFFATSRCVGHPWPGHRRPVRAARLRALVWQSHPEQRRPAVLRTAALLASHPAAALPWRRPGCVGRGAGGRGPDAGTAAVCGLLSDFIHPEGADESAFPRCERAVASGLSGFQKVSWSLAALQSGRTAPS